MLDKVVVMIVYAALAFVGLASLPYLLWRVWDNTIPLKKKTRGADFDLRG